MDINDAIAHFEQYVDNDVYSDAHRTACKMAVDALRAQLAADHVSDAANMMPRLIDANELLKKQFMTREFDATARGWTLEVVSAKDIEDSPTIDPENLRPHGRWEVVIGSDGKERMVCTVCRKQQDLTGVFSYCPNCGAEMDKEMLESEVSG